MKVYYSMYIICFFSTYIVERIKIPNQKWQKKEIIGWICFLVLAILIALRHQTMGIDLRPDVGYGYLGMYEYIGRASWATIWKESFLNYEKGYVVLNKILNYISKDRQLLLISCSFISIIPIGYVVSKRSELPLLSFFVYMGLPLIQIQFSGLRQSIALGICFLSFEFIREKKIFKFIIFILLATTFHFSALLFIFSYPIYHYMRIKKDKRLFTIIGILIVYVMKKTIFVFLSSLYKTNVEIDDTGAFRLLLVFILLYVFCLIFSDDTDEIIGLLNIFLVACIIQCFAGINHLVMRVGFYYIQFIILLLPNVIMKINNMNYLRISRDLSFTFFVIYSLIVLHSSSYAMSYPYYFFWEKIIY